MSLDTLPAELPRVPMVADFFLNALNKKLMKKATDVFPFVPVTAILYLTLLV